MRINSLFAFCCSLVATFLGPALFPTLHLFYFAPFLILCLYSRKSLESYLWKALGCGLLLDLFTPTAFFGLTAFNYLCVLLFLRPLKRYLFEDTLFTLPLMTFLFSIASTLHLLLMARLLQIRALTWPITLNWVLTDLLLMSAADALFGFLVFSLLPLCWQRKPN